MTARGRVRRPSREELKAVIKATEGNMTALAARLGITRQTAYSWVAAAGLDSFVGIEPRHEREEEAQPAAPAAIPSPAATDDSLISMTIKVQRSTWLALRIRALQESRSTGAIVEAALRAHVETVKR